MRRREAGGPGGLILTSFLIAFVLDGLPMPASVARLWPEWTSVVLIYWVMVVPGRVGIGSGWCLGLLLDAARGTLLGQHAMALAAVAFLTARTHQRLRVFPAWQQALVVLLFSVLGQLLVTWVNGIVGYPPRDLWFLGPALGNMLVWPWLYLVLRDLTRHPVSR